MDDPHFGASRLVGEVGGPRDFSDTNYIFLSFVTRYLPVGLVGLVMAVILAATMSASSCEIASLATVTVVDLYRRHISRGRSDHHYPVASRFATPVLGRIRSGVRRLGQPSGAANCRRERGGIAVLWFAAGLLRAGLRIPARGWKRRIHGHANRRGGCFRSLPVQQHLLALVERNRLRGCHGLRIRYYLRPAAKVAFVSLTGCTIAPSPAESQAANRTIFSLRC